MKCAEKKAASAAAATTPTQASRKASKSFDIAEEHECSVNLYAISINIFNENHCVRLHDDRTCNGCTTAHGYGNQHQETEHRQMCHYLLQSWRNTDPHTHTNTHTYTQASAPHSIRFWCSFFRRFIYTGCELPSHSSLRTFSLGHKNAHKQPCNMNHAHTP